MAYVTNIYLYLENAYCCTECGELDMYAGNAGGVGVMITITRFINLAGVVMKFLLMIFNYFAVAMVAYMTTQILSSIYGTG